jgi:hypothetical protein
MLNFETKQSVQKIKFFTGLRKGFVTPFLQMAIKHILKLVVPHQKCNIFKLTINSEDKFLIRFRKKFCYPRHPCKWP